MSHKLGVHCSWFQFLHFILFFVQHATVKIDELTASDWDIYCKFQPNSFQCVKHFSETKFYFDLKRQDCVEFKYGGCPGTFGMFSTQSECRDACRDVGLHRIKKNISIGIVCRLQQDFGDCNSYFPMWYYDLTSHECRGFSYSGCGGNAHRFETAITCAANCAKLRDITLTTTPPSATKEELASNEIDTLKSFDWKELCKFQPNTTSCNRDTLLTRYYFDLKMEDCKTFEYRGCPDPSNYFEDMTSCRETCRDVGLHPIKKNLSSTIFCHFQPDFGRCNDYNPMWYYDVAEQTCRGFSYSGCGGNANRFETRDVCNSVCKLP